MTCKFSNLKVNFIYYVYSSLTCISVHLVSVIYQFIYKLSAPTSFLSLSTGCTVDSKVHEACLVPSVQSSSVPPWIMEEALHCLHQNIGLQNIRGKGKPLVSSKQLISCFRSVFDDKNIIKTDQLVIANIISLRIIMNKCLLIIYKCYLIIC